MVLRFLLLFVLIYLFFSILHLFVSRHRRQRNLRPREDATPVEEMVLDPQCQSYVPKREAVLRGSHYFCSEECARLYLAR